MTIKGEYKGILLLLKAKFGKLIRQKNKGVGEVLLVIVLGLHLGHDTISALCEKLLIPRHQIYNQLKKLSLREWRRLFQAVFEDFATEELGELFEKSAATQSRANIMLSIDDSVLRRWGGTLGYIGKWWSGQFKHIVLGQDVVLITLKIDQLIIPVRMWIMSKKGRCNHRHERVVRLLESLAQHWQAQGIDVGKIAVTADAGYASKSLVVRIQGQGFKKVLTGVKKHYRIRSHRSKIKKTKALSEVLTKEGLQNQPITAWGVDEKIAIYQGISPTQGRVTVCARYMLGKVRYVFAYQIHRGAEIYKLWKGHYRIEQVFKRLKQYLAWGKARLRRNEGAHANVILPFIAYFVVLILQKRLKNVTFEKIIQTMNFWESPDICEILKCIDVEHFHCELLAKASLSST